MTTIRAFSSSPAQRWWRFGRMPGLIPMAATWALLFGFNLGRGASGPWLFAATVVVVATVELLVGIVPLAHRRVRRTLRFLHAQLPWFDADVVAWLPREREDALRAALADAGVVVHDVDGRTVRTLDDLARALDVPVDARWLRMNAVQRPVATMTMSLPKDGKVHAFVWRDANVLAQVDPAGLHRFVTEWRLQQPTRSLLFFVASPGAATTSSPRVAAATA